MFLFEDRNLAASTLRTFKAAILSVLSPRQMFTPAESGTLNKLCNSFKRRRPLKPSSIPTWGIGLVPRAFSKALFEPLDTASLQAVSYKTFVLVALALGAHRGVSFALYIAAISFVLPTLVFCAVIFLLVVYSQHGQG